MWDKILKGVIKTGIDIGRKAYQKQQLNKKANTYGPVIDTISCVLKRSGISFWQDGQLAITGEYLLFAVIGQQKNLSGSETIPLAGFSYSRTTIKTIFGTQDAIEFRHRGLDFQITFAKGNRARLEKALATASA